MSKQQRCLSFKDELPQSKQSTVFKKWKYAKIWLMGASIPSGCDPDPSLVPLEEEPRLEDLRLDTVLQDDKVKLTMPRSRIKRYNNIGQSEINLLIDEIEAKNHRGGYCHEHLNRCEYQVTECRYWDRDLTEVT